jgi:RNA polymerase sigma factor (sigma-70 family)
VEASALSAPQAHRLRISISAPLLRLRSDEQLVALFRAGNEDAFRTIHDRYRARLYAYVRQMLGGSKSDAEDALQDVFLRAYSALQANGKEIALRAWLYRVAHNRCIDQLRRPVPHAADVYDVSRTPTVDPSTASERREDLRRLVEDVRRLPEQQRSVLLMREMEGLSYADLAAALDVSIPAVKSLLVRARMGLVQAAEARDTACFEVRQDIAAAHGRGVRANGRARRHLRDCAGCRAYRSELRGRQRALAGLSPVAGAGPLSVLAKLIGGGGAAGGAAGGTAVAGGGAMVGGTAALSATKLALVVGAAVVTAGGAVEVRSELDKPVHTRATHAQATAASPRAAQALSGRERPRSLAVSAAASASGPIGGSSRAHQHKAAAPDPLAGRPDVLAPAPADTLPPAPLPTTTTTTPATSTTTAVPGGRDLQSAVDSAPKLLPTGSTTNSQSASQTASSSGQSTTSSSSSSTSSGSGSSSSTGQSSTSSGTTSGSGSGATASGASASGSGGPAG